MRSDDDPWYRALGPARRPSGRPDYSLVDDRLFVGEYPTPDDAGWLRATLGVTAVVNLQDEMDLASKFLRARDLDLAYREQQIAFHHLPICDGDGAALVAQLEQLVPLITDLIRTGGCVYLHCNAGMNRAPTVAIAYLHGARGVPLHEACATVKKRRSCLPYMKVLEAHYLGAS